MWGHIIHSTSPTFRGLCETRNKYGLHGRYTYLIVHAYFLVRVKFDSDFSFIVFIVLRHLSYSHSSYSHSYWQFSPSTHNKLHVYTKTLFTGEQSESLSYDVNHMYIRNTTPRYQYQNCVI